MARARQSAADAILRVLAGVGGAESTSGGDGPERVRLPGMRTEVLEGLLTVRVDRFEDPGDELQAELERRVAGSRLRHRDVLRLLFSAKGPGWQKMRLLALDQAARMPPAAATLLHWQAEKCGAKPQHTTSSCPQGFRSAWSWEEPDGRVVAGPERAAGDRRTALHSAAVALLAQLCGLPEPQDQVRDRASKAAAPIQPVPEGQDPVKYVNKYTQLEVITKPDSTFTGRPGAVTCTYTCRHVASGVTVRATAAAKGKGEARRAAAAALLVKLVHLETQETAKPVDPSPPPSTPPASPPPSGAAAPSSGILMTPSLQNSTVPDGDGPPAPPAIPRPARQVPAPSPPGAEATSAPEGALAAAAVISEALAAGCALTLVPATDRQPAGVLLYRADGGPMPEVRLPAPLTATLHPLMVPAAARPIPVAGWTLPLGHAVPVLLGQDRIAAWHPTAVEWEQAARLGVQLVAAGLIYPALTADGVDQWRVGPLPADARRAAGELAHRMSPHAHAVAVSGRTQQAHEAVYAFLHALADTMVRTPAAAMFGSGPFLTTDGLRMRGTDVEAVRPWLEALEERLDDGPLPGLVLDVAEPAEGQNPDGRLTGRLLLASGQERPAGEVPAHLLWAGRAYLRGADRHEPREQVQRRLERLARRCAVLAGLISSPEALKLDAAGILQLLQAEDELAARGLQVRWPRSLREGLSTYAVVGTTPKTPVAGVPRFSLQALLDFRWQVALGDDTLSDAEMDELAEAARPLVRVRGRWVLLDPVVYARVRHRSIGRLAGIDALTAALTGTVTVEGQQIPCRAVGELGGIVSTLRQGEHISPVAPPDRLKGVLRGYQERALAWLSHTSKIGFGAVLADDMGLGKTLTAIAYTLHRQEVGHTGPVLVVCPSSLVTNWQREIGRFAPHLHVICYHGTHRSLDSVGEHTVVITTYGVLRQDAKLAARTWDLVVADEAQHAKNHTSATIRYLRSLTSTARLALTGTPVENNLSELWTLIDWANPGLFGTLKTFRSRYAAAAEREPDGPAAHALGRLIAPFLLRRAKSDPGIAPELPAKVDTRRIVELTPEQAALYEAVVRETMDQIAHSADAARSGLVFKLITALKQITNHPAHYLGESHPGPVHVRQFAGRSAKLEALAELAEAIVQRGEAALVFTSYVAMGELLQQHLSHLGHRPMFLHGALGIRQRQHLVDAFQSGRTPLLVLSLKAGGTGLNLTRASHVIHFDRSWNAAVEDQASDRAHRIGQRQTVAVHRLITRGTIEDRIDQLLDHKRALQRTVLASGDTGLARLTDRELADLVRLGGPA
ncbi:SNF2-related protein [Streptomyces sp. NPDC090127]|uniref:DEAD/DEAH box helicase n=1 Tax=Streptomyces sp. NPDC090127 TaxID=3365953 RepID=UPI003829E625